jgi:anti-sigma regulatory factor (Ser/Thr protein kinase)
MLALRLIAVAGLHGCRIYTLSSDGAALVLRGSACSDTLASWSTAPVDRQRLPLAALPWLETAGWQGWRAAGPGSPDHGWERAAQMTCLCPTSERRPVSLLPVRSGQRVLGVVSVRFQPTTSAADRAREAHLVERELDQWQPALARAVTARSRGLTARFWWQLAADLPYGAVVVNQSTRVLAANPAAAGQDWCGALIGRRLCTADAPCQCPVHTALRSGEQAEVALADAFAGCGTPSGDPRRVRLRPLTPVPDGAPVLLMTFAAGASAPEAGFPAPLATLAAMITHELRTPIASLRFSSELALDLETHASAGERRSLLEIIARQSLRLEELVQEITDVYLIQSGRIELRPVPLNLRLLCDEAVAAHAQLGGTHRFVITGGDGPAFALGDRQKLRTVLTNLIGNAAKYSPPDSTIRLDLASTPDAVLIAVQDEGPGIAEQDLPHLFDSFYRAQGTAARTQGYGLGLYIVRTLVDLHRGRVWVENVPEGGSRFTVSLPRVDGPPPATPNIQFVQEMVPPRPLGIPPGRSSQRGNSHGPASGTAIIDRP